jgi:hypothetical protein
MRMSAMRMTVEEAAPMRYADFHVLLGLAYRQSSRYVREALVEAISRIAQLGDVLGAPPELDEHLVDLVEDLLYFKPKLSGRDGFYGEEGLGFVLASWLERLPSPD